MCCIFNGFFVPNYTFVSKQYEQKAFYIIVVNKNICSIWIKSFWKGVVDDSMDYVLTIMD